MPVAVKTADDPIRFEAATRWVHGTDGSLLVYADQTLVAEFPPGGWSWAAFPGPVRSTTVGDLALAPR